MIKKDIEIEIPRFSEYGSCFDEKGRLAQLDNYGWNTPPTPNPDEAGLETCEGSVSHHGNGAWEVIDVEDIDPRFDRHGTVRGRWEP